MTPNTNIHTAIVTIKKKHYGRIYVADCNSIDVVPQQQVSCKTNERCDNIKCETTTTTIKRHSKCLAMMPQVSRMSMSMCITVHVGNELVSNSVTSPFHDYPCHIIHFSPYYETIYLPSSTCTIVVKRGTFFF